jgi:hypothetical protein
MTTAQAEQNIQKVAVPARAHISGVAFHVAIPGRPVNVTSIGINAPTMYQRPGPKPAMEQVAAGVLITWGTFGSTPGLRILVPFSNISAIVYSDEG